MVTLKQNLEVLWLDQARPKFNKSWEIRVEQESSFMHYHIGKLLNKLRVHNSWQHLPAVWEKKPKTKQKSRRFQFDEGTQQLARIKILINPQWSCLILNCSVISASTVYMYWCWIPSKNMSVVQLHSPVVYTLFWVLCKAWTRAVWSIGAQAGIIIIPSQLLRNGIVMPPK